MIDPAKHVIEYVDDYLHRVLSPIEADSVQQHCARCPICRTALDEAHKRFDAMKAFEPAEPSEKLVAATMARVHKRVSSRWTRGRVMGWVGMALAACIVIAGSIHLYIHNMSPTPYDLSVLWQDELWAGSDASLRLRLARQDTGKAVESADVRIELKDASSNWVQLTSFKTDAAGSGNSRMKLPDWPAGKYELRVIARTGSNEEVLHRGVALKRAWRLMLSSDKPVYQPGQTIHLRSLALRKPNLKPVAGELVTFIVTDPKSNMIFRQAGVTSAYGIASADCALDTEIIEGNYAIECHVGDTVSKQTVEVKRYVLPKFRIDVKLDRPFYQPIETVRGTIHAEYFFGKPVSGTARITSGGQTIDAALDANGNGDLSFRLPQKLAVSMQRVFHDRVVIEVEVADTAGQSQQRTISAVFTNEPLQIELIPETGALLRGSNNLVYVLARYADGRPAKVRMTVAGRSDEIVTNELGVASMMLQPADEQIDVALRAVDDSGMVAQKTVTLKCGQPLEAFAVRPDKAVYDAGETMTLTPLGAGTEPILLDLVKDGQTLLTHTLSANAPLAFDLPPEVYGTIQLSAYRFAPGGVPVRKTQVIYVRPPLGVNVSAELDRAEYAPGGRAKLTMALTDSAGKPVPGAISLSAVDEAVFSVLDAMPGLEKTFFNIEQELLKPVYAVYAWSPDDSAKSETAKLLERAIFARTAAVASDDERARLMAEWDLTPDVFEALSRPDADVILENANIQEPYRSRLLAMRSRQTIFTTTYPEKAAKLERERARGEEAMEGVWIGIGIAGGIFIILLIGRIAKILAVLFVGALLVSIMLPSLNRARESSNKVKAASAMRQMEQAMTLSDAQKTLNKITSAVDSPRLRQWFPETLLWKPELITDASGRVSLDIDLADSITTWRLGASAVTADGRLGALRSGIKVFQPFFVDLDLPVALVRGDEIAIRVAAYNYLDRPQMVSLAIEKQEWFELLDEPARSLELSKDEVRSVTYRIRARHVGKHALTITARGEGGVGDAIKREIEVVPNGRRVERVKNGTLQQPMAMTVSVPANAIEGSAKLFLKLYPSTFSQLVDGLENIFQMPHGCFEQTSSTTYPNVLALDYLRQTNKSAPEIEAKAKQYIHLGYQRLLGFEVSGGGFDWYGSAPANRVLTAYGLMEFEDMSRVLDVDPRLIERTRNWLLAQRRGDGTWENDSRGAYGEDGALATTAYIAMAVFANGHERQQGRATAQYLASRSPEQLKDTYTLAMVTAALQQIDPQRAGPYAAKLESLKRNSDDGKTAWWEPGRRTVFYSSGQSGAIETTALAAQALIKQGGYPATARAALAWLISQKDARGTWHSTQATVQALRALLAGTGAPLGGGQERRIELAIGGHVQLITIPADQDEVVKQIDLSSFVKPGAVVNLRMSESTATAIGCQVAYRYHLHDDQVPAHGPLSISLAYDKVEVPVGVSLNVTATIINRQASALPMVMVDLPIPAGFAAGDDAVAQLRRAGEVAKVQVTPRGLIAYLRELPANATLKLDYSLKAQAPASVTAPAARVYEYYDPANDAQTAEQKLVIAPL